MASSPSPEESEIRRRGRRRLLGAVTLVLLLVVFVPMILDSEPRSTRTEPSLSIPPKENIAPLPAPAKADAAPAKADAAPAKAESAPAKAEPEAAKVEAPPAKVEPAAPKAEAPAAKVEPVAPKAARAAPKLEGFAVQVGAFRDEARLQQSRAKLEAAGIVHYTERVEVKGGTITRLRAGPFPTREAAEKAHAKLKAASLDGKVVPLP